MRTTSSPDDDLVARARDDAGPMSIDRHALRGSGGGRVDARLLLPAPLGGGTSLWTRGPGLDAVAARFGIAYRPGAAG